MKVSFLTISLRKSGQFCCVKFIPSPPSKAFGSMEPEGIGALAMPFVVVLSADSVESPSAVLEEALPDEVIVASSSALLLGSGLD